MADYVRKCQNWLASYKEWVMPRIAAPESYIFWSGMFCLSAAVRRNIYIGKSSLGTWECFPHCYIMLVGPPGFRKNTSMGPAIELLQEVSNAGFITKAPAFITKESLLDSIFKSPDSSVYLTVEEFGDLLLKSGPEMYEFLTSMFDAKKNVEQKTLSRSYEMAEKPCLNLLAGTTPQWIADKMPESVIGGGLASRIIFIYEEKAPRSRIFFRNDPKSFKPLHDDLIQDLSHIANNLEGEFEVPEDVMQWMEDWNMKSEGVTKKHPKLAGYYARKITHILKLAQLFHISYSDTLRLSITDVSSAVGIIESTERNLPKVFAGVGKNMYSLDARDILRFISEHPRSKRSDVLKEFETVATVPKLDELINGLQDMLYIKGRFDEEVKEIVYEIVKEKDEIKSRSSAENVRTGEQVIPEGKE